MKRITKTQIITIVSLIIYTVWELYLIKWNAGEIGPVIRVDLLIVYPILLLLITFSIIQLYIYNK